MSRRVVTVAESSTLYASPTWCAVLILQELRDVLPRGRWLEPTCGDGSLMLAVNRVQPPASWVGVELVEEHAARARRYVPGSEVHVGDARQVVPTLGQFDVAISNNPFPEAAEIVRACLACSAWVLNLQRLDWLEGAPRRAFFVAHPPDVWVLPNRPSFRGRGQDSGGYAWFLWSPERERAAGLVRWLPTVPRSLRVESRLQQRLL